MRFFLERQSPEQAENYITRRRILHKDKFICRNSDQPWLWCDNIIGKPYRKEMHKERNDIEDRLIAWPYRRALHSYSRN